MKAGIFRLSKFNVVALVVFLVMSYFATGCGCPVGFDGTVFSSTNNTSVPVKVTITWTTKDDTEIPEVIPFQQNDGLLVLPNETQKSLTRVDPKGDKGMYFKYYITVVTESGLLWQKVFTWDESDEMDWTIVIESR